jgi:serine/threonine protein kinase
VQSLETNRQYAVKAFSK